MSATTQLFVLRHAKSSWDDPGLDDHDRPLAPRGQRAVKLLYDYITAHGDRAVAGAVLHRPADSRDARGRRADWRATDRARALRSERRRDSRAAPPACPRRRFGDGDRAQPGDADPRAATRGQRDVERATTTSPPCERKFPTGALATLTFECAWSELPPGRGAAHRARPAEGPEPRAETLQPS